MPQIASLSVLLTGDASSLTKATRVGVKAVVGFGKAVGKAALIGGAAGGAAFLGTAAALAKLGNAARESIDAHAKNAARLGLTVTEAQKLQLAASQADLQMRTLNTAMASLSREAGLAAAGSEKAQKKFTDLGLSMEEVAAASPFERLQLVTRALGETANFAERAAKGNALFGESWIKLNPLINSGGEAFRDANRIFGELGLGLGDGAGAVEQFNDRLSSLSALGVALRDKVFATLAPQLADISEKLLDGAAAFIKARGGGEAFAQSIAGDLVNGIRSAVMWFGDLKNAIDGVLTVAGFLVDTIQAAGIVGAGLAAAGTAALEGNFSGAGRVLGEIAPDVRAQFGDDVSGEQLNETKRQTSVLEDIARNLGPAFQ